MGVPAFFRWLTQKYPKLTTIVKETSVTQLQNINNAEASSNHNPQMKLQRSLHLPNPNEREFDALYLDMNGIIHPCCHPEGKPPPRSIAEMFDAICNYIDRLVAMIRPRKLLYLAIDGVAPRAKMNQQRSRRFRAAQEADQKRAEAEDEVDENEDEFLMESTVFDSNCITPGTPFMSKLSEALNAYILTRQNPSIAIDNNLWNNIQVIFSDASVPGEGEHKIMEFIRSQRSSSGYSPNTSHVLYGLDADLIMLGLITHEPDFFVLREDIFSDSRRKEGCWNCSSLSHSSSECPDKPAAIADNEKPFLLFSIANLREYLKMEFKEYKNANFERIIDDWVFLCFFVGNDFLPHIPSLDIREGAIDTLVSIYKKLLKIGRGGSEGTNLNYLTSGGKVRVHAVLDLMHELSFLEDSIFQKRARKAENFKRRRLQQEQERNEGQQQSSFSTRKIDNAVAARLIAASLKKQAQEENTDNSNETNSRKRGRDAYYQNDVGEEIPDAVRLHEPGYKARYYEQKFQIELKNSSDFIKRYLLTLLTFNGLLD